MPQWFKQL